MIDTRHLPWVGVVSLGAIVVGLAIGCGPEADAGTANAGTAETGGGATGAADSGSTGTESAGIDSANASSSEADATSSPTTGADSGTTATSADTATEGSGSTTATEASTGVAGDCTSFESLADCEAAGCVWIGDEKVGMCLPDVEPTGGDVCEPLGMQQCEAAPQCTWDAEAGACLPV